MFFLAIDQGTTNSRAIIFNEKGHFIASGQYEISSYYPQNGWVEHDAEEIWRTTLKSCEDAIRNAGLTSQEIAGMGITNQRETTVVWNKRTKEPIYHAIVWQDRRSAATCEALKAQGLETWVQQKTGLLLDPYFSATKLSWILENIPHARQLANKGELLFGTIETFLLWRLTDGECHYSDVTNASRTLLFNLHTQNWDPELLALFNIPATLLPHIVDNHGKFGKTSPHLFGHSIPICAMMGDQQAAAFGQACFHEGMVKSTYGTGCFMLLNTGTKVAISKHKLLSTVQYRIPGHFAYGIEGSIFIAGAAVQWLRDGLGLIKSSKEIQTLAAEVNDNGGVYFVPAFTGLGAPFWNPHARGIIAGLTRDSKAAHIAKSVLEAICYQTRDIFEALQQEGNSIKCLRVDGGMVVNADILQFLADMLAIEIWRPKVIETTALGIAYLIGLELGVYQSLEEINACYQLDQKFYPKMSESQREQYYKEWSYWVSMQIEKGA